MWDLICNPFSISSWYEKTTLPFSIRLNSILYPLQLFSRRRGKNPSSKIQQPTPEPEPPAPTQYTLTVTSGEGGTVSTEGGTYDEGTEVTITATPDEGYEFIGEDMPVV